MKEPTILTEMPLSDFIDKYTKTPFELAKGRILPLIPNILGHQLVVRTLFLLLNSYLTTEKRGEVFFETPFVISDRPDWVKVSRTPDLSYFTAERWTTYLTQSAEAKGNPIILIPDLAVEVVTPSDLYTEIHEKIDSYLADGVQLVWVINPQRRTVVIHTTGNDSQVTLKESSILTAGTVLSNFSVPLKKLFE